MKHLLSIASICVLSLSGMQSPVEIIRQENCKIVFEILSEEHPTDEQYEIIDKIFTQENMRTLMWFSLHKYYLQNSINQTIPDVNVDITGSRKWQTSHLLSDIDAVIITNEINHEKVFTALQAFYKDIYPDVDQSKMTTKAGLSLFVLKNFSDTMLGTVKLEYTIQSPQINDLIVTSMTEKLKTQFPNRFDKVRYACAKMRAVHDKDEAARLKLKEWTRILPHTENKS